MVEDTVRAGVKDTARARAGATVRATVRVSA